MSRRIIWMRKRSVGWSNISNGMRGPLSLLRTIDIFWTTLRDGFWSWIAERGFRGRGIIRRGWSRKKPGWRSRRRPNRPDKKRWLGNWNGFEKAQRQGRRNPRLDCKHTSRWSTRTNGSANKKWRFLFLRARGWGSA